MWHVAQEESLSPERLLSKKRYLPRATMAAEAGSPGRGAKGSTMDSGGISTERDGKVPMVTEEEGVAVGKEAGVAVGAVVAVGNAVAVASAPPQAARPRDSPRTARPVVNLLRCTRMVPSLWLAAVCAWLHTTLRYQT
jgi:hypothetical protein